jgi:hypothetical protein
LINAPSYYVECNGAIAAWLQGGVIENCAIGGTVWNGDVNGSIVGRLWGDGSIKNCAACGDVSRGELVGRLEGGSVTGCVFINPAYSSRSGLIKFRRAFFISKEVAS